MGENSDDPAAPPPDASPSVYPGRLMMQVDGSNTWLPATNDVTYSSTGQYALASTRVGPEMCFGNGLIR